MIERMASAIPLVEIGVSGFDVLRSIRLARNFSGPFAIVGFASITNSARTLCDLLQYEIETITISAEEEVDEYLVHLKERGFTLIVGDTVVVNRAKTLGLGAILIMSGPESVRAALDQAVKLSRQISQSNSNEVLYRNILDDIFEYVAVFNSSGDEVFLNFSSKRNSDIDTRILKKYIADLNKKGHVGISVKQKNALWSIKSSKHTVGGNDYFIFCVNPVSERQDSNIFRFLNYDEISPNQMEVYYGAQDISLNPALKANICGEYPSPILIVGEYGACKETIAKLVHINSHFRDCPMVIVDSWLIDEKKWNPVIEGRNSLNSLQGCSICIKNIQYIPAGIQKKMALCLKNTLLSQNNRLIFSLTEGVNDSEIQEFYNYLIGDIGCVTISVPPLRDRRNDIPSLASLYIGEENQKLAKQVIGFEKNALNILQQFDWPQNTAQLKKVLNELLVMTTDSYISEHDVKIVLSKERKIYDASVQTVNIKGTLDEITKSIISSVLVSEKMNQTKTAKRLGISRSTLWKKLKQ